ncbi:unnamed protein product [Protopolystoma xenopodis]|uniref:Uncharacterized protein n=1 Tax=Protopolystoma xenopodis TaxID=117903 RepID=A0A448X6M4_9PLAT|nr:unnamed protein product [Protopolystoma xenopodis]
MFFRVVFSASSTFASTLPCTSISPERGFFRCFFKGGRTNNECSSFFVCVDVKVGSGRKEGDNICAGACKEWTDRVQTAFLARQIKSC